MKFCGKCGHKRCSYCKEYFYPPWEFFHKSKVTGDGLQYACIGCSKVQDKRTKHKKINFIPGYNPVLKTSKSGYAGLSNRYIPRSAVKAC